MKKLLFFIALFSACGYGSLNAQSAGSFSEIKIGTNTSTVGSVTRMTIVPPKHSNFWFLNTRDTGNDAFLDLFYSTMQQITFKWNIGVGIGTNNPQHKLDVNGTIRAKEVKVESGWADFVFDDNYDLPSLNEIEAHIKKHKHLPNIPTDADVKENGVSLGEMNVKLLQKIEELTLYMIQQNKEIEVLHSEIEKLKN